MLPSVGRRGVGSVVIGGWGMRWSTARYPGVVLDIDGVLIRGKKEIPGAGSALTKLIEHNVPYVLLTNGSGLEAKKAQTVSSITGVHIPPERVIVSHTALQDVPDLLHKRCLICGQRSVAEAAKAYGFTNAVWSVDHFNHHPERVPLRWREGLKRPVPPPPPVLGTPESGEGFEAVLVMGEPTDWNSDIQLIIDCLRTNPTTGEVTNSQQIPLYWCNDDLTYVDEHHVPRFAGGALSVCVQELFRRLTGQTLDIIQYGKPYDVQYTFAMKRLQQFADYPITTVVCVGDNLHSDIKGANRAGKEFLSVLVLTGLNERAPEAGSVHIDLIPDMTYNNVDSVVEDVLKLGDYPAEDTPLSHASHPAAAPQLKITVLESEECGLCSVGMDTLYDVLDTLSLDDVAIATLDIATLPEDQRENHRLRIPVFLASVDGEEAEIGHGRVTHKAMEWKLKKFLRHHYTPPPSAASA